ncbi:unnamed protein product [Cunninghamella blakesleeana]
MSFIIDTSKYQLSPQPEAVEIAFQIIGLCLLTVICILFGLKTYNVQYKYLSYSRWLILSLYFCSWAFTFCAIPLVLTNNGNFISCIFLNVACDVFYTGTKFIIYCWLVEKVWVVNASRTSRWKTKSYIFHMLLLSPYIGIIAYLLSFHKARIEENGICIIGFQLGSAILLMIYDFLINLYMTILFVRPLMKIDKNAQVDLRASRLQEVAKRTLLASVVCLLISFANILVLILFNGEARGALCLICCFIDVSVNVCTIHWVTTQPTGKTTRGGLSGMNYSGDMKASTFTTQSQQGTSSAENTSNPKTKFKNEYISEQYGEFGHHHTSWNHDYNEAHHNQYMSATNTNIMTTPIPYHPPTYNEPINHTYNTPPVNKNTNNVKSNSNQSTIHSLNNNLSSHHQYTNGRFVMVADNNDDDHHMHSRTSSIHESYSSKQSLTKVPLH